MVSTFFALTARGSRSQPKAQLSLAVAARSDTAGNAVDRFLHAVETLRYID
jgi:hypothetical protein